MVVLPPVLDTQRSVWLYSAFTQRTCAWGSLFLCACDFRAWRVSPSLHHPNPPLRHRPPRRHPSKDIYSPVGIHVLLQFSVANVCKHALAQNFDVPTSSTGASRPKPLGLTPRPYASLC